MPGMLTAMPTHLSMFCSAAAADVVAIDRATRKAATKRPDEKRWAYILMPFAVFAVNRLLGESPAVLTNVSCSRV